MTDELDTRAAAADIAPQTPTAGATLRSAREAVGLSIDDVAQQLKLAPRQVQALEEDDFQRLPGRTFARGFARNYARFVQLDPEAVVALMPSGDAAPALERPSFASARRPMGEMPLERAAKRPAAARTLLLLLALVVAGAAAFYEYSRRPHAGREGASDVAAPSSAVAPATPMASGSTTTALPNPAAESAPGTTSPPASVAEPVAAEPAAAAAPAEAPGTTAGSAAKSTDPALVLSFKGTSWAEVKDASGRVILQMTGGAGMTQTVSGTPPLELSLGNAPEVVVTFRGQALDLAPYTRGVVARVGLK